MMHCRLDERLVAFYPDLEVIALNRLTKIIVRLDGRLQKHLKQTGVKAGKLFVMNLEPQLKLRSFTKSLGGKLIKPLA